MTSLSGINRCSNKTITIDIVKLSKTEERKNVNIEIPQSNLRLSLARMKSVMILNPPGESKNIDHSRLHRRVIDPRCLAFFHLIIPLPDKINDRVYQ